MHDRTKDLDIPMDVKRRVAERDSVDGWPCCLVCGRPAPTSNPLAYSNAHYISRSQGGLGVEKNILTLCPDCHRKYDTTGRRELGTILTMLLREKYDDWSPEDIIYKK